MANLTARIGRAAEIVARMAELARPFAMARDAATAGAFMHAFGTVAGRYLAGEVPAARFRAVCRELERDARGTR